MPRRINHKSQRIVHLVLVSLSGPPCIVFLTYYKAVSCQLQGTAVAQRLNGGLPLTPKLLGYSHNTMGKLVINPDEAPTVKLIFYMYLSSYSSACIAKTLEELGKTTFLGNTKWTSGAVIQILRNERHCGDVLTRKTWTPDAAVYCGAIGSSKSPGRSVIKCLI